MGCQAQEIRLDGQLRVALPAAEAARVTEILAAERLWVTELRPEERSLEDLFLELTGDNDTAPDALPRGGPAAEVGS